MFEKEQINETLNSDTVYTENKMDTVPSSPFTQQQTLDQNTSNSSSDKENSMDLQNTNIYPDDHVLSPFKSQEVPNHILNISDDALKHLPPSENETPLFVTCGPNKAILYLERLDKGSKGASVLFDNWWLTPNEFQRVSGRGTAKDWKRSIKHHGRSLKLLMSKSMLFLNPPICKCDYCTGNASPEKHESVSMETTNVMSLSSPRFESLDNKLNGYLGDNVLLKDVLIKEMDQAEQSSKELTNYQSHSLQNHSTGKVSNSEEMKAANVTHISEKESCVEKYIQSTGSIQVTPALGDNKSSSCFSKADDNEKIGGNAGGNHPRLEDKQSSCQINEAGLKLASLTPGNPQIEGNSNQMQAKCSTAPLSIIINSEITNESSEFDSTKIKQSADDKCAPSSFTSELSSSEVNGEIKLQLNLETNSKVGETKNNPAASKADEIDSFPCSPPQHNSPVEANNEKAADYPSTCDSASLQGTDTKSEALGTPPSTPVQSMRMPVKGDSPGITRAPGTVETGATSPPKRLCNEEEGPGLMSPKKEARLINIIEELKHYKKCLEVQIQQQKQVSQNQHGQAVSPTQVNQTQHGQVISPNQLNYTQYIQAKSPIQLNQIPHDKANSPNHLNQIQYDLAKSPNQLMSPVSNNGISNSSTFKIPFTYKNNNDNDLRNDLLSPQYFDGGDLHNKKGCDPPEVTIDHSSHATGTVHWGKPKGHSPMHTNNAYQVGRNSHQNNSMLCSSIYNSNVTSKSSSCNSYSSEKLHKRTVSLPESSPGSHKWQSYNPAMQMSSPKFTNTKLEIPNPCQKLKQHLALKSQRKSPPSSRSINHSPPSSINNSPPYLDQYSNSKEKMAELNYAMYASMAAQFCGSQTADMNAYFLYISECIQKGQMPNVYGFYNSLAKTSSAIGAGKDKSPISSATSIQRDSRKRHSSGSASNFKHNLNGVLDLSVKRQKNCDNSSGSSYDREHFNVDNNGVLDLSIK